MIYFLIYIFEPTSKLVLPWIIRYVIRSVETVYRLRATHLLRKGYYWLMRNILWDVVCPYQFFYIIIVNPVLSDLCLVVASFQIFSTNSKTYHRIENYLNEFLTWFWHINWAVKIIKTFKRFDKKTKFRY